MHLLIGYGSVSREGAVSQEKELISVEHLLLQQPNEEVTVPYERFLAMDGLT